MTFLWIKPPVTFYSKADFGDLGGGPFSTDDPGWQTEANTFQPWVIMGYVASGQLQYWNGTQWTTNLPDNERLHLIDALGTDTIWSSSGVTNAEGAVDQVLGDGSIHSHLDFNIENTNGNGDPAVGAYLIELSMLARDNLGGPIAHDISAPFKIAFNNQLTTQEFNQAISALTSINVSIDIQPSDAQNFVETEGPYSQKMFVAILGSPSFDATQVDAATVTLGPNNAPALNVPGNIRDANNDGNPDQQVRFRIADTGILCEHPDDVELSGETYGGVEIYGSDFVTTPDCPEASCH